MHCKQGHRVQKMDQTIQKMFECKKIFGFFCKSFADQRHLVTEGKHGRADVKTLAGDLH